MKIEFNRSRLLPVCAIAVLVAAFCRNVSSAGFIPVRLHATAKIHSVVPISGDEHVITAEVLATDFGWANVFGHFTSILRLTVEIDVATGLPLRGGGEVVQTNVDGSTVIWENHFEGTQTESRIIGGTGRFKSAEGQVRGESVVTEIGTVFTQERGWITSLGAN